MSWSIFGQFISVIEKKLITESFCMSLSISIYVDWTEFSEEHCFSHRSRFGGICFISEMLYFRFIKTVQYNNFVVFVVFLVYSMVRSFSNWVVPVFLIEYLWSPPGYVACFLNLSFDVLSVIFRLHNLRPPFKIPLFSRLRHTLSFIWGPYYVAYQGIVLLSHWRFLLITTVWTHLWKFKVQNL